MDTKVDPANCSDCGKACPAATGAKPVCVAGQCGLSCLPPLRDCNGKPEDGCETDTSMSQTDCGACGNVCPMMASNAMPKCTNGTCQKNCAGGFDDCDQDLSNGCEAELAKDSKNCGMCGKTCNTANAEVCNNGQCQPGLLIKVEGHADVLVSCKAGDYSCQAKQICEKITNTTCIYQDFQCCGGGGVGSWYPNDGQSGNSAFNFAYNYDFCPTTPNYGNICACNAGQMGKYGLASNHNSCGLGHWFRQ